MEMNLYTKKELEKKELVSSNHRFLLLLIFIGLSFLPNHSFGQFGSNGFNLFSNGVVRLTNSDVEGRVAARGATTINGGYQIGKLMPASSSRYDLVVDNTVSITNAGTVALETGGFMHSGTLSQSGGTIQIRNRMQIFKGATTSVVNFATTQALLLDRSLSMSKLSNTASKSFSSGTLTITGTNASVNVLNLPTGFREFPGTVFFVNIKIPSTASLIINYGDSNPITVPPINTKNNGTLLLGDNGARGPRAFSSRILWNFYNATNITMTNVGWKGTILAPKANFKADNGHIDGQVFVSSLTKDGTNQSQIQINWFPYTGTVPCPTITAPSVAAQSRCGTGAVTFTATGCSGTVNWYDGTALVKTATIYTTPSISATKTYHATCTINSCTSGKTAATATIKALPTAPRSSREYVCAKGTSLTLNSTGCTGGTIKWYSAAGTLLQSSTNPNFAAMNIQQTTNYSVTCTINGCESAKTSTGVDLRTTPAAPRSSREYLCGTGKSLTLNSTGCSGTIKWYSSGGTLLQSSTNPNFAATNVQQTTNYDITCTVNGCESAKTRTGVDVRAVPAAPKVPSEFLCGPGGSLTLNSTGCADIVNWYSSGGTLLQSSTNENFAARNITQTTSYGVSCEVNGCESAKTTTSVQVRPKPTINITGGSVITCTTTSLTLTAAPNPSGGTYDWSGPGIRSGDGTNKIVINKAGTYTVTYNLNGCSATDNFVVTTDNSKPNGGANGAICAPTTIYNLPDAPAGSTWYAQTGNPSTAVIHSTLGQVSNITTAGTYRFILKDVSSNCTDTVQILKKNLPGVNAVGGVLTCSIKTITASSSVSPAGGTYAWTGPGVVSGGTTASPKLNKAGTYTLTYTYNGCSATDLASVTNDVAKPNAGPNVSICAPTNTYDLGDAPAGTSWSADPTNPGTALIHASIGRVDRMTVTGVFKFILKDISSACADTVQITRKALPTLKVTGGILTCAKPTIQLQVDNISPNGGTYLWTGPGITASNSRTVEPIVNKVGTYTLTYTFDGCSASATATVTSDLAKPNAGANASICDKATVASTYDLANAPAGTAWAAQAGNPSAAVINASSGAITGMTNVGTYRFILKDISSTCSDTVQILKKVTPSVTANGGVLTCAKSSINLQGGGNPSGGTYAWAGPGIVSGSTGSAPLVNKIGTYTLTYSFNGCSASATATVTSDLSKPNAGPNASICAPTTTYDLLNAPTGTAWAAQAGNPTPTAAINATTGAITGMTNIGTYKFILKDVSSSCSDTALIIKRPLPTVRVEGGMITCATSTITLQSGVTPAGGTYVWTGPGITASNATAVSPTVNKVGTYTLTYTLNGCTASGTATVTNDLSKPDGGANKSMCAPATTLTLKAAPAGTAWSAMTGNPSAATISAAGAISGMNNVGIYRFILKDITSSCADTVQVTKNDLTSIKSISGGVLTCTVSSITGNATATPVGGTFLWEGPSVVSGRNTATPKLDKVGTYKLTYTLNGCSTSAITTVTNDLAKPDGGANGSICSPVTTFALKAAPAGTAWSAMTGNPSAATVASTGAVAGMTNVGTYRFILKDISSSCADTVSITKKQTPTISSVTGGVLTCTVSSIKLGSSVSPTGGTYLWESPVLGIVSGGNTATPTVNKAGSYPLLYTVNGCSASAIATVTNDLAKPDGGANGSICEPATAFTLKAAPAGTAWSAMTGNPSAATVASTGAVAGMTNVGTYRFILKDISSSCADTVSVTKNDAPTIVSVTANDFSCGITTVVVESEVTPTGGTYLWAGPGIVSDGTTATPIVNRAGTYTLTYTYEGCSASESVVINTNEKPSEPLKVLGASLCEPGIATLSTEGCSVDNTAKWYLDANATQEAPGVNTGDTYTTPVLSATTQYYVLCVSDSDPTCKSSAVNATVTVGTIPDISADGSIETCFNGRLMSDGSIELFGFLAGDRFDIVPGRTYTGNADYSTASEIPADGLIASNIKSGHYAIKIFRENSNCDQIVVAEVLHRDCGFDCTIPDESDKMLCEPISVLDLPDAKAGEEWIADPMNATPAVINPTTGEITGMTVNGIYTFILQNIQDNTCFDRVNVFRGVMNMPPITVCATTHQLPTTPGVTWTVLSGSATVTASGLITGMNNDGLYQFVSNFNGCTTSIDVNKISISAGIDYTICLPKNQLNLFEAPSGMTWVAASANNPVVNIGAVTGVITDINQVGVYKFVLQSLESTIICSDTMTVTVTDNNPEIALCDDGSSSYTIVAPSNLTDVIWYNSDGTSVGNGSTLQVTSATLGLEDGSEAYYYQGVDSSATSVCDTELCCPVKFVTRNCCPTPNCLEITVIKN